MAEGRAECWEGLAPQPRVSAQSGFPFHTVFVPGPWLSPLGRTSVGTVPVSPAIAAPAFLSVIRLFLGARHKDAKGERKYLMPQQSF